MLGLEHRLRRIEESNARIEASQKLIISLIKKEIFMDQVLSQQVQDLQASVAQETTVEQSAITLLQRLTQLIQGAANSGDLAKVEALATQISANTNALAAAVAANTPATPVVS